jgi:translation initiation factor 5B
MIRQPIVVIVGHIDHGKSSILEKIKGISITKAEEGGITQTIKSYNIPINAIEKFCGGLLQTLNLDLTIPGLLFLDSPGHAAFNNMRKRGGNLADLAILTININEGIKEQTLECIQILKQYKTPFIVALNKIDLIPGWRPNNQGILKDLENQAESVRNIFETKLYEIVGTLSEHGINAERFDRVDDYTKQVAMIPVSAKTQEGIPELLMVLTGLAQKFLEQSLEIKESGEGKATILEIQETPGMGTTLDVILYDGQIKKGDQILIGTLNEPIQTKIRGLFEPEGKSMKAIESAHAAYGLRISAPNIDNAIGGMPLIVANRDIETKKRELITEIESVLIDTETEGVIVKADTLGSLEALTALLQKQGIKIKKASIGNITKKDISEAVSENETTYRAILGFNVKEIEQDPKVKTILSGVIYKIIDKYQGWSEQEKKKEKETQLEELTRPVRLRIIRGCIFRQSNPCVLGVNIEAGILKTNIKLMKKDGSKLSYIKSMQQEKESKSKLESGNEVAISIPDIIADRHVKEDEILYSNLTENEFEELKRLKGLLKKEEIQVLKEIAEIKRKENPIWGV